MNIDPVAITLGPLKIYWYSLSYIVGIFIGIKYAKILIAAKKERITSEIMDRFLNTLILGVLIGGRLGHVLFFDLLHYINNPLKIFYIWEGGMSFHGGCIGVFCSIYFFSKKEKLPFWGFCDVVVTCTPIAIFLGRIANFINQELYGTPTNLPWGVVFKRIDNIPRHPSQIYEALTEGLILFFIMRFFYKNNILQKKLVGVFIIFYSVFRFFIEFLKEPDTNVNIQLLQNYGLSIGQLISCIFVLIGILIIKRKNNEEHL